MTAQNLNFYKSHHDMGPTPFHSLQFVANKHLMVLFKFIRKSSTQKREPGNMFLKIKFFIIESVNLKLSLFVSPQLYDTFPLCTDIQALGWPCLATGEWGCSMSAPKKSAKKVNTKTQFMHLDLRFFSSKYLAFLLKLSKLETKCETLHSLNFTQRI